MFEIAQFKIYKINIGYFKIDVQQKNFEFNFFAFSLNNLPNFYRKYYNLYWG